MPTTSLGPEIYNIPHTSDSDVNTLVDYEEPTTPTTGRIRARDPVTEFRGICVGDRVRLVSYMDSQINQIAAGRVHNDFYYGMEGVVKIIMPHSEWCYEVHFDNYHSDGLPIRGALGVTEVELVPAGPPSWEV